MSVAQKIISEIEKAKTILVAAHRNPEADALGSSLAIFHHFGKDKKITVFYDDSLPYFLEFLPGVELVVHDLAKLSRDFDLAVIVDCANLSRVCEKFPEFIKGKRILNIDHHESNALYGELNLVEPKASSTGEVLFKMFSNSDRLIRKNTATCLYAAISNDTGSFQYTNTSQYSLETASSLVKLGANPAAIAHYLYETHPRSRLMLLAQMLQTLKFSDDGRRGEVTLTKKMFESTGANVAMSEGFVNFLTATAGVEVAILFREQGPDKYKISLRSFGDLNVSKLCEKHGGGGHSQAAGCTIEGKLEDVQATVRKEVDELLSRKSK